MPRDFALLSELPQARSLHVEDREENETPVLRSWMNEAGVNVITVFRPARNFSVDAQTLLEGGCSETFIGAGDADEIVETIRQQASAHKLCEYALDRVLADIRESSKLYLEACGMKGAQGRLIFIQSHVSPLHLTWLHVDANHERGVRSVKFPYRLLISYAGGGVRWYANENVKPEYWSQLANFGPSPEEALLDPDWYYDTNDGDIVFLRSNNPGGVAHISPPFSRPRLRFDLW